MWFNTGRAISSTAYHAAVVLVGGALVARWWRVDSVGARVVGAGVSFVSGGGGSYSFGGRTSAAVMWWWWWWWYRHIAAQFGRRGGERARREKEEQR